MTRRAAPWAAFFGKHDFSGITGAVYTSLARTVDPSYARLAITSLRRAATGYCEDMARSRSFSLIALSLNHLVEGDEDEAALEPPPRLAVVGLLTSHGGGTRFATVARTFGVPVVAVSAIEPAAPVADAYLPEPAHPLRVLAAVRDLLSPDP